MVDIEHTALNVADPSAAADWYVAHLGMRLVRQGGPPTHTSFLAADGGAIIELYHAAGIAVPDYASQDPMLFHVAFASPAARADADRLVAAGAARVGETRTTDAGDTLIFLRDPWGIALQLVERTEPLV